MKCKLSEYPEIKIEDCENKQCIMVKPTGRVCYGRSGFYRVEWLKNQFRNQYYGGLRILTGTTTNLYHLKICTDKPLFSEILSDHVDSYIGGGSEE